MNSITVKILLAILVLSGQAYSLESSLQSKKVYPIHIQCKITNSANSIINLDVEYFRTDGFSGPGLVELDRHQVWGQWHSTYVDGASRLNGMTKFQFTAKLNNSEAGYLTMNLILDPTYKTGFGAGQYFGKTIFLQCKFE
jgi:hypothetical protein